jgi:DNA ligase (NAD+)
MNTPTLIQKYLAAKEAYYAGSPIMSDAAFDSLERDLAKTTPELLLQIGAPERGGKVPLPAPMGSLNQVFNESDFNRWAIKYPKNTLAVLTEKIDGNSALLKYKNGVLMNSFSRGNGKQGANNLRHTRLMASIPQRIGDSFTGLIRGEIAIPKADWEEVRELATTHSGKDYANARNFTAGFLNGKTGMKGLYKYFKFVAFEIIGIDLSKQQMISALGAAGFTTPVTHISALNKLTFTECRKICDEMVKNSAFEADGTVLDVDAIDVRDKEVDPDDLNPSHAIKIKPEAGAATTTVTHVEWNASKDGLLKPTVHFEPVQLVGVTIRKASGYNAKYVVDNGIGPGAVVSITRQGDVIPRVNEVLVAAEVEIPERAEWGATHVDLYTTNTEHVHAISMQILEHFFDKMQVDHMGAGNVVKLYEAGITTPIEAITATYDVYEGAVGSNGMKAHKSLHSKLTLLTPARLFAALGSFGRGMGERKLTALFNMFPFDQVLNVSITTMDIATIDGFERKSARKILDRVDDAREQYDAVKDYIAFMMPKAKPAGGKFTGQVFCPTGVRFTPDIADAITNQGGEITDTFGSKVTTLVAKDPNSGSSKVQKALDKGVKVISLDQLKDLL